MDIYNINNNTNTKHDKFLHVINLMTYSIGMCIYFAFDSVINRYIPPVSGDQAIWVNFILVNAVLQMCTATVHIIF